MIDPGILGYLFFLQSVNTKNYHQQPKQRCSKHTPMRPNNIFTPSLQEFRSQTSDG